MDELGASEASRKEIAKNWLVQNRLWVFAIRTPCRPYGSAILHLGVAVAGSLNAHQSPCYSDSLADVPTKNENVVFVCGMPDLMYNSFRPTGTNLYLWSYVVFYGYQTSYQLLITS